MTHQTPSRRKTLSLASVGALVAGIGAVAAGFWLRNRNAASPEHAAPDLALDAPRPDGSARAPVAFRPDPTAPVSAAERESLRPATGPSPSIVADRGGVRSGG
ncbi:hypothetical protein OKW76_04895 [Sphingomonas sp. S1-29]|uniref:hypothetical protein n=1 Tax=Sphingomonas sp. S1-29 TaxID=2991074 RepID=UPI00223F78E1|nr:hypothetical protein [Sphingomonas sp. S1-29]UZK70387.1 hypothetical protein OKW76_04895 [Sphingomonas sp. S1-29]